jgi:hypothetical protein
MIVSFNDCHPSQALARRGLVPLGLLILLRLKGGCPAAGLGHQKVHVIAGFEGA